jgi:hypothetical protein
VSKLTVGAVSSGYSFPMLTNNDYRRGIVSDESMMGFCASAEGLPSEAKALSAEVSGRNSELNRWMDIAKQRDMTWTEGLYFSVDCMRDRQECDA